MFPRSDDQVVITYRDSNFVWKDRALAPAFLTAREVSPTERWIDCFVPTFWGDVTHPARIQHVGVTTDGRTTELPWPPPETEQPPRPALAMHLRLRHAPGDAPSTVAWGKEGHR